MAERTSWPLRSARILARRALRYVEGTDPALDRPAHVRAASGVVWLGDELAVIQDDANFLALVDPHTALARAIPLPPGPDGKRLFDDSRGTKQLKLDLEAVFTVAHAGTELLIALGSGTKPARERILMLRYEAATRSVHELRLIDAHTLYAALHAETRFSGSELNLEGGIATGGELLLFQRGNGAVREQHSPLNAIGRLSLADFLRYLEADGGGSVPQLQQVTSYDLGEATAGVPYTFTDGALDPTGHVLFLASAEASADAVSDGAVFGSYVGELAPDGRVELAPLLDEQGAPARLKTEGMVLHREDPTRAFIVVDMDEPSVASELLEVRLERRSTP